MSEMQQDTKEAPQAEETPAKTGGSGKRQRAGIIVVLLIVVGFAAGIRWWVKSSTHISTDNAFIESQVHSISSRVGGNVVRVAVKDNQLVRKGDILVELDGGDYATRAAQAGAALSIARNETSEEYARVDEAKAAVTNARARLEQAELDLKRGRSLFEREVIPKEQLDRLQTARKVALSLVQEAEERVKQREAQIGLSSKNGKEAKVAQRAAQLKEAELNLAYTRIVAPADGYITRKGVEAGNNIQPGQPLMALVPLENAWITANYKERQLTHVRPGQKVEFEVDAYPGHKFTGKVDSIMAGTGAAFSLLPPENATGNYVKVVQRIPVKIVIDKNTDPERLLRVGMSVVPTILVNRTFGDIFKDLNIF